MIGGTHEAWDRHFERQRKAERFEMVVAIGAMLVLVLAIGMVVSVWLAY